MPFLYKKSRVPGLNPRISMAYLWILSQIAPIIRCGDKSGALRVPQPINALARNRSKRQDENFNTFFLQPEIVTLSLDSNIRDDTTRRIQSRCRSRRFDRVFEEDEENNDFYLH